MRWKCLKKNGLRNGLKGATAQAYEFVRRGAKWETLLEKFTLLQTKKQKAYSNLPVARINFHLYAAQYS
jgi:hypothetical protein